MAIKSLDCVVKTLDCVVKTLDCVVKNLTNQLIPKQQISDSSKQKEFADDNFKFNKNGRKFSKWIENTVEKGEIACYEQFLLFPLCFQRTCTEGTHGNQGLFGKGLSTFQDDNWYSKLRKLINLYWTKDNWSNHV